MSVLLAKLALGLGGAVLGAFLGSGERAYALSARRFDALAIALAVGSRLSLFVAVYVVLGAAAHSDVLGIYYPQALSALAGKLVHRDFPSSYAPLFPYVAALPLLVWHSPKAIILLAVLAEALALPLWLRSARTLLGDRPARLSIILYACSGLPLLDVVIEGQNQAYCAFFFALSVALLLSRRPFLAGLAAGASLGVVKFIAILHAPAPFAAAGAGRARFFVAGASLPLLVYGGFLLAGADVFASLRVEAALISSGNLPFLLGWPGGPAVGAVATPALALALLGVVGWGLRSGVAAAPRALFPFGALVLLTFMIVSKKAYAYYLVIGFFPIAATVAARAPGFAGMLAFGLFGALAAVEPSLWFRWLDARSLAVAAHAGGASRALLAVFVACDVALVGGYVVLWRQALGLLRRAPATAT